ncbi:39S ribosomal protein L12, mitochondrial [Dendroctonus ponderosae]
MQSATKLAVRSIARQWRQLHTSVPALLTHGAQEPAMEPLEIPPPSGIEKPVSEKINRIATDISQLNLIEVSELSSVLKSRLNLPDAPVFPAGGFAMANPAAEEDEEAAPVKVQTSFTVKLMKFEDKQKVALIKEIKNLMEGMNLVQAKKFVESSPAVVKADIPKDEADKLKEAIEKVGGTVEIA